MVEGKKDFTEKYQKHRNIMNSNGGDIDRMIEIRRDIHKHPEGGFKEFRT